MGILSRIFGTAALAQPVQTRRFDAATGRRWEGTPHFGNVATETLAAGQPVLARARYFVANNPWAAAAINALVAALVGPGIRAAGSPEATAAFDAWARVADADGRTDLWGLMAAAVRGMIGDGESFTHIEDGPDGLSLRLLAAEMVDPSYTINLPSGGYIIGGIEFDARGRRVAYHVFRRRPDMLGASPERIRVPAGDMLHLCRPIGAGQVRGVSWLAPVLLRLRELDILEDALAKGVSIAALHAGFLIDQNGTGSEPFDGLDYVQPGDTLSIPAPAAVLSGAVVIAGGIIGVAANSAESGAAVDVNTKGVWTLSKVSADAFTVGAAVYYVTASGLVSTTSAGNTRIGLAVAAAGAGVASVAVRLSGI